MAKLNQIYQQGASTFQELCFSNVIGRVLKLLNEIIPYEDDEITRLIIDDHDVEAK